MFSRTFALQLKASRLEHTRRYLNHEILPLNQGESPPWPNNEGFVGAEITRLGVVHAKLNEFCDTSYYNWAPAFPEPILAGIPPNTIIHPLLDMPRFIKSISKNQKWVESLLDATTRLGKIGLQCDPKTLIPGLLRYFIKTRNLTALESLRQYATERDARARALFNVARGKPATQSSTCNYSIFDTTSQDAAGAVNGVVTGKFGFHTDADLFPWWCVDLELSYPVREILIHNRLDLPRRAHSLMVACSNDMLSWRTLYEHTGKPPFGGADGEPLRIEFKIPVEIRFLRLQLQHQEVLHLDEVEIFI